MTSVFDYEQMVDHLVALKVPREKAEARARELCGVPAPDPAIDEGALEKQIEYAADVLMAKLGFEAIRFSHPGKTKQTPGIADRRYYRRPRTAIRRDGRFHMPAIAVWFEAKSTTGRQRPGQKLFQELVEACGEPYVCGTHEVLIDWVIAQRIARRDGGALELFEPLEPVAPLSE